MDIGLFRIKGYIEEASKPFFNSLHLPLRLRCKRSKEKKESAEDSYCSNIVLHLLPDSTIFFFFFFFVEHYTLVILLNTLSQLCTTYFETKTTFRM